MSLKRKDDWDQALHKFVEDNRRTVFAWGQHDCCLFVCDGILAMTGSDIAAEFRGKYGDQTSAEAVIKTVTGTGSTVEDVATYVTKQNSMPELPSVNFAQRGDVVLFQGQHGLALGFVYLDGRRAVFLGETGMRALPVSQCLKAWRV